MRDKTINQKSETKAAEDLGRMPYRRPVLVKLGTIRDLTLKTTGGTAADGGKSWQKTGRGGRYAADGTRLAD